MKLFFVVFLILSIFFVSPLDAKDNNIEKNKFYLKNSLGYENSVMLNSGIIEIQAIIKTPFFTGDIGASLNDFSQDITTNFRIAPYQTQYVNVGLNPFFHVGIFLDIGQEIDIGMRAFIDITNKQSKNPFTFSLEVGSFYKFTFINILPKHLTDFDVIGSVTFSQRFLEYHKIAFRISSYENYYYPLFLNPSFHLNYEFNITDTSTIGTEFFLRYTDMLTLTGTIDGFQGKLFYKLTLPL